MALQSIIPILKLTHSETIHLETLSNSRSVSILRARRAAMLLDYCDEVPVCEIARSFRTGCAEVERYIDKALREEVLEPREKIKRKSDAQVFTAEVVAWVCDLARQDPRALGHASAQWSKSLLAEHIRKHCRTMGHHALADLKYRDITQFVPALGKDLSADTTSMIGDPRVL